jgi:hypothetical protein
MNGIVTAQIVQYTVLPVVILKGKKKNFTAENPK